MNIKKMYTYHQHQLINGKVESSYRTKTSSYQFMYFRPHSKPRTPRNQPLIWAELECVPHWDYSPGQSFPVFRPCHSHWAHTAQTHVRHSFQSKMVGDTERQLCGNFCRFNKALAFPGHHHHVFVCCSSQHLSLPSLSPSFDISSGRL